MKVVSPSVWMVNVQMLTNWFEMVDNVMNCYQISDLVQTL